MKKDKKVGAHNVKGAIIEIIISLIVMAGVFALTVYDNHISTTSRFYSRIGYYALFFGLALISFISGIFVLVSLKKQKKNQEPENSENNKEA